MLETDRIARFAAAFYDADRGDLKIQVTPLRGGLCAEVARVRLRLPGPHTVHFVVKHVSGPDIRELRVYQDLLKRVDGGVAPRLLGADRLGANEAHLYLEWVQPSRPWPWGDLQASQRVLAQLGRIHESLPVRRVPHWDYENELAESAISTLEMADATARQTGAPGLRRLLPALRRLVGNLPSFRRQLLSGPWRPVVLHGDAHTGNARLRRQRGSEDAVLLDWARARTGSPMEDVCSWLQSLGFWEVEPKRRHDTLVLAYLHARGLSGPLGPTARSAYWLAGASNGLAGALRYHVSVLSDPASPENARSTAADYVRDWGRILVRADASWRN